MTSVTRRLVVCAVACLAMAGRSGAQQKAEDEGRAVFEAADVHASARTATIRLPFINSEMRGGYIRAGRYELRNATMSDLIGTAWGVDTDKVIGGPAWLDTDQFDVIAAAAAGATPERLRLMLRSLLEDRFKLIVHPDTRDFRGYALTAGGHLQIKEAAAGGESGCKSLPQNSQGNSVSCHNITMAEFANGLPRIARCCQATAVTDLTGLKGGWDFTVGWSDQSIYAAVEQQLGLKLEVQQIPRPVIVVESVNEKPGESQSVTAVPSRFEVADIKPSAPGSAQRDLRVGPGGRFIARGFTLKELIKLAWEMQDLDVIDNDDMLVGFPKGFDATRFDIVAEISGTGSHTTGGFDTDAARLMLRALLTERFRLATHYEERPVAAYAMVAVKVKLNKADAASRPGCRNAPPPSGMSPIFSLHCQNVTMAQLAEELPAFGGLYVTHPVFDATGLNGGWDFDLSWSPPHLIQGQEPGLPPPGAPVAENPNGALTIVEALGRLGLKLEPQKHPMPVLVIDRVEPKPTDN
jgi:uncharacterized protein (TIGR03435 family)